MGKIPYERKVMDEIAVGLVDFHLMVDLIILAVKGSEIRLGHTICRYNVRTYPYRK